MALRATFRKSTVGDIACLFSPRRFSHAVALPAPSNQAIGSHSPPPCCLPEHGFSSDVGFRFPDFVSGGGSMELMAVPKKKISRHKRGIRNGPKALKPIPVIIRCRNCGQVKLPHFYCCGGPAVGARKKLLRSDPK